MLMLFRSMVACGGGFIVHVETGRNLAFILGDHLSLAFGRYRPFLIGIKILLLVYSQHTP